MKIKQLLLSLVTLSVFLVSCSKEEIGGVDIQPKQSTEQVQLSTNASTTQNARVGTESNLKAYIFIEKQSKLTNVVNYLKTVPRNPQSTGPIFYSCWTMVGIQNTNFRDLNNYLSMPLWTNGVQPQVIQADIPQVSGGVDSYGNSKTAYNFTTVKIPKNTINDNAWVLVVIPVSAMNNDTRRLTKVSYYAMNGTRIVSSNTNTQTTINLNPQLSSYLINYTGTVIPQGLYRVYSTYSTVGMRFGFNSTNDVYLRGLSN